MWFTHEVDAISCDRVGGHESHSWWQLCGRRKHIWAERRHCGTTDAAGTAFCPWNSLHSRTNACHRDDTAPTTGCPPKIDEASTGTGSTGQVFGSRWSSPPAVPLLRQWPVLTALLSTHWLLTPYCPPMLNCWWASYCALRALAERSSPKAASWQRLLYSTSISAETCWRYLERNLTQSKSPTKPRLCDQLQKRTFEAGISRCNFYLSTLPADCLYAYPLLTTCWVSREKATLVSC